jgi:hypothetical protein
MEGQVNPQLQTIANRIPGLPAKERQEIVEAACRVERERLIRKVQDVAQQSACSACNNFLTSFAESLRKP